MFCFRHFKEIAVDNITEQYAGVSKPGFAILNSITDASLAGIGDLVQLNLQTARAIIARGVENLAALSDLRDLPGLVVLQRSISLSAIEQALGYSHRVYEICNESAHHLNESFGNCLAELGGGVVEVIEKGRHNTPPSIEFALAATKSLLSMAGLMYGNMSKLASPLSASIESAAPASGEGSVKRVDTTLP